MRCDLRVVGVHKGDPVLHPVDARVVFGEPEPLGVDVYRDHMLAGEGELDGVAADAWVRLG